jgi:hypothetical protein
MERPLSGVRRMEHNEGTEYPDKEAREKHTG